MAFFDSFSARHRKTLRALAEEFHFSSGEPVLQTGDAGGDLYFLQRGELQAGATVLSAHDDLIGIEEFVRHAPIPFNVAARTDTTVLRIRREDLLSTLQQDTALKAAFYKEALKYVTGHRSAPQETTTDPSPPTDADFSAIAEDLTAADEAGADSSSITSRVAGVLDRLQRTLTDAFDGVNSPEHRQQIERAFAKQLHPHLKRSATFVQSISRAKGATGLARLLDRVNAHEPEGDGALGVAIDAWLLSRPSFEATRTIYPALEARLREGLAHLQRRKVLLVNAGTGRLASAIATGLEGAATDITVIDPRRFSLDEIQRQIPDRPELTLTTAQGDLVRFALGRSRTRLAPQDAIVVHGLVEYLPDRVVFSLFQVVAQTLERGGIVIVASLTASDDHAFLDHAMLIPTLRRTQARMASMLQAAGLEPLPGSPAQPPTLLTTAQRRIDA